MIGVLTNTLTVLIGASLGLLLKRGIPEKVSDAVMKAIGLCTVFIGISGALQGENTIVGNMDGVFGIELYMAVDACALIPPALVLCRNYVHSKYIVLLKAHNIRNIHLKRRVAAEITLQRTTI